MISFLNKLVPNAKPALGQVFQENRSKTSKVAICIPSLFKTRVLTRLAKLDLLDRLLV